MEWINKNWKSLLIALVILILLWVFLVKKKKTSNPIPVVGQAVLPATDNADVYAGDTKYTVGGFNKLLLKIYNKADEKDVLVVGPIVDIMMKGMQQSDTQDINGPFYLSDYLAKPDIDALNGVLAKYA